jgi:hypothetical protein
LIARPGSFIAESPIIPQCPKGRGSEFFPGSQRVNRWVKLLGRRIIVVDLTEKTAGLCSIGCSKKASN